MRLLRRDCSDIVYKNYVSQTETIDDNGLMTGGFSVNYSEPLNLYGNIMDSGGKVVHDVFGVEFQCDKVIITEEVNSVINELSVFYINADVNASYDYVVSKIRRTPNFIAIALSKVYNNG